MNLIKYCRPEHNLYTGCSTLQLGTLDYYRKHEAQGTTGDTDEGKEETIIESLNDDNASPEALSAIPYRINAKNVTVRNARSILRAPNCYIFSCSHGQTGHLDGIGLRMDAGYTSSFRIGAILPFIESVQRGIHHTLKHSDLRTDAINVLSSEIGSMAGIRVLCEYGPVEYVESTDTRIRGGEIVQDNRANGLKQLVFRKKKAFEWQREFRFMFYLSSISGSILSVEEGPLLVRGFPVLENP